MTTVAAAARQAAVSMLVFLAEGDTENAQLVVTHYSSDVGPVVGFKHAADHLLSELAAVAVLLGDAETFRAMAGALAVQEG